MSQQVTRKTRSRKKSLYVQGSQISEENQSFGATKSCSVNVMSEKENPESQVVMDKPTADIDDIIDDFDLEDELKEDTAMDTDNVHLSGTHFNGVKSSEQDSDSASDCYTDDIEEEVEEEEEEELEEEINDDEEYVQPNANKGEILLLFNF